MLNCSIYPINPHTGKDSSLYKELLFKLGNRDVALLKYGEYYSANPQAFEGEFEPSLASLDPTFIAPVIEPISSSSQINENTNIAPIQTQSELINYNEDSREYQIADNPTPNRVTSIVQYFTGRELKKDFNEEDLATKEADRLWKNYPKEEKQTIEGRDVNYKEFVESRIKKIKLGAIKGNAIHSWLQYAASGDKTFEQNALKYEAQTTGMSRLGGTLDYSWALEHAPTLFKNAGILLEDQGNLKADIIKPEVRIYNNLINAAGTADMLVYHADNSVSILDWKTGENFGSEIYNKLLEFGLQTRLITDNPKNRAKLQIALYAFMLKLNNPDIQFKNLKVCHIPNSHSVSKPFTDADVDMENYLPMIEALFRDKEFLSSRGLSTDTLSKIKESSPRAFNISDYQRISNTSYQQIKDLGASNAAALKIADVRYLSNKAETERLTKEEQRVLADSTRQLLEMEDILGIKLPKEVSKNYEIDLITRLTGTYMDTNNPYLRSLKVLQDRRMDLAVNKYTKIENRFNRLRESVEKEHPELSSGVRAGKYNIKSNPEFWDWAFTEKIDEEGASIKELLHDGKKEWNSLSESKKALLSFVQEQQSSYFEGPNAYLNKTIYKEDGVNYSVLEFFNKQTNGTKQGFKYNRGWFAKTALTEAEINRKSGGKLTLSAIKEKAKIMLTDFIETNYEGVNQYGIPLKYIGSAEVIKSGNFSTNLEQSFLSFMKHITLKEQLDDVYSVAQGIKAIHELSEDKNKNVLFKETLKFIDDRVLADLVGRTHKEVLFRVPFVTNANGDKLDAYKLIAFLKKIATFSIMGFVPVRGIKNGLFASMVNYRKSRVNWIGTKFFGIEGNEIDYTPEDLAKANKLVTQYYGATIRGDYRKHKLYHLAKESRYLTHDVLNKANSSYVTKGNTSLMDTALSFYSVPEEWNSLSVLVAQMLHMKTKDGKSIYNQYDVVNDQLIWNGGIRGYTENSVGDKIPLRGLNSLEFGSMRRVYEKLHGQYRQDERSTAELYMFGNLLMMFSRHVGTYYRNNFGNPDVDDYQGGYRKKGTTLTIDEKGISKEVDVYEWISEINRGRYRLLYQLFRGMRGYQDLSNAEKKSVIEAYYNIGSSVVFAALVGLLSGLIFDDDEDEDSPRQKMLDALVRDYRSPVFGGFTSGGKGSTVLGTEIGEMTTAFSNYAMSYVGYQTGILSEDRAKTNDGTYKGEKRLINRLPLVRAISNNLQFAENDGDRYILEDE